MSSDIGVLDRNEALISSWILWFISILIYTHQYFLRVSISALAPSLIKSFHLSPVALSEVGASFFIAYGIMQIFAGILIDKFGVEKLLLLSSFFISLFSMLFAYASNVYMLTFSRFGMGLFSALPFIAALVIIRKVFNQKHFALLTALTTTVGYLGGTLAEGPLSYLLGIRGWREIMLFSSIISIVLFIILCFITFIRRAQLRAEAVQNKFTLASFINILKIRDFWLVGIFSISLCLSIIIFAALWAEPFLFYQYGLPVEKAENIVSYIFIGAAVGAPILAFVSGRVENFKRLMLGIVTLTFALIVLTLHVKLPLWVLMLSFAMLGLTVGGTALGFVVLRRMVAEEVSGSAFAILNAMMVGMPALLLVPVGYIIKCFNPSHLITQNYTLRGIEYGLTIIPLVLFIAMVTTAFINAKYCVTEASN